MRSGTSDDAASDDGLRKRPLVTIGETMGLLHSITPEPLEHAASMALAIGGSESNVAIGVARLGWPASWVSKLGHDSFGIRIRRELLAEGVNVVAAVDPHAPTGLMLKERRSSRDTQVTYYRRSSAASGISPSDIPEGLIEGAGHLHLTGITPALSSSARDTVMSALERAVASLVPVSIDLNYRAQLWHGKSPIALYAELLAAADVVFASEQEAALICDPRRVENESEDPSEDYSDALSSLLALGPREAVITLGSQGAVASDGTTTCRQKARPVSVVDTVGAGDAFVAGYLFERLRGSALPARVATGILAGAAACLGAGDWESLPHPADIESLRASAHAVALDSVQR